jgi:phosphoglycolate phosphatase
MQNLSEKMGALLFDLDGTLIDSKKDLTNAVNAALSAIGKPWLPVEEIQKNIGLGMDNLIRKTAKTKDQALLALAKETFSAFYENSLLDYTRTYEGIERILQDLWPFYKMAVVTNKAKPFTQPILRGLGLERFFVKVVTPEDARSKKPDPTPILYALRRLNVCPERALVIGDSRYDIESGKRAGIKTIAVTWGFGTPEEIKNSSPDWVVTSPKELAVLLGLF